MTEFRDTFDESLLSAYLDGELKDEERAHVERVLLERPDLRAMLQSLQSIRTQLRSLQVVRSPNDLRQKVLPRIEAMRTPSAPPPRPTLLSNRFRWAAVAAGVAAVMALMPWVTSDRSNTHLAERVSELDRGLPADSEMRQDSQDNNALVPAPRSASTSGAVNEMPKSGESDVEILADKSAAGNLPVAVDGGEVTENGRRGETLGEVQVQTLNVDALSPEMQSYVLSNDISTVLNVKTSAPITRDELLDALANREIAVDELMSDSEGVGDSSESRVAEGSALEEVETQVPNGKEVSSPQVAVASGPVTTQDQVAEPQKDEVTVRYIFKNNQWSYRQRDADTIVMVDAPLTTILSLVQDVHHQSSQREKLAENETDLTKSLRPDDLQRDSTEKERLMVPMDAAKNKVVASEGKKRSLEEESKEPLSRFRRSQLGQRNQLGRAALLPNGVAGPSAHSAPQDVNAFNATHAESQQQLNSLRGWGVPAAGNDRVLLILSPE